MSPALDIPPSIGRYTIERTLGTGAMGQVYLAFDTRLQRRVALKVLRAGAATLGLDAVETALREARAASAIVHPHATAVFDADEVDGVAFIVMEYVPGTLLRRFIGDPTQPLATRVRWLVDVAGALAAAHAVGVVHRDVKPENVMVRDDGVVKVLDFGIARVPAHDDASDAPRSLAATWSHGGFVGTPGYMAPEMLLQQEMDARADQFGWGVLAYELLAGKLPWKRVDTAFGMIASAITDQPAPLGGDVPPEIAAAVARALAKSPGERFPSLAHAAAALAPFAELAVTSYQAPPVSRRRTVPPPPPAPLPEPTPPAPHVFTGTIASAGAPLPGPAPPRPAEAAPPTTMPTPRPPPLLEAPRSQPPPASAVQPSSLPRPPSEAPPEPASTLAPGSAPQTPAAFRVPNFAAPVDVEGHLALLPPDATCKGMFFLDLLEFASKARSPSDLAYLAGIPARRYLPFRDYPMADNLRLSVAIAGAVFPRLPTGEALRRMGNRAFDLVLGSHLGRTLFDIFGRDPEPILLHGPRAYRLLIGLGEVRSEQLGPREFILHARGLPLYLETYQVGVLEGVLRHCRRRGDVRIALEGLDAARLWLRLDV
jgi:serine/threonine-protein kinase